MDIETTLTRLEGLLREERAAIVAFDAATLERCAEERASLLAALRAAPDPGPTEAARYEALGVAFRHNVALLSLGRACLREAIATFSSGRRAPASSDDQQGTSTRRSRRGVAA